MTDEFAINIIEQYRKKPTLVNEIKTVEEAVWIDEALDMAIKALEQINKIKAIIESPIYVQEDVFRYKAICDVFKSEEQT